MGIQFNVVQVGFGPMGQLVAKLLLKRENINLISIIDIAEEYQEKSISEILGNENLPDMKISANLGEYLTKEIDVVVIATSSFFETIAPMIMDVVKASINVITLCEQLSYSLDFHPELSKKIDDLAKENNVTVVGSGINPGYLMDLLPIVLTAPCETVEKIVVTRMMNSSRRRIPFQKKIGTGLTVEEFKKKISEKEITGHVGLQESMQMINNALGLNCDEIIELPPEPKIAEKEIDGPYGKVTIGNVIGLNSIGIAKKDGNEIIRLDFTAFAGDHEEYDSVEISGIPGISQIIKGGVHGDVGTASMITNLIPKVVEARSGLLTMKDLPAPCYTANIWKK